MFISAELLLNLAIACIIIINLYVLKLLSMVLVGYGRAIQKTIGDDVQRYPVMKETIWREFKRSNMKLASTAGLNFVCAIFLDIAFIVFSIFIN